MFNAHTHIREISRRRRNLGLAGFASMLLDLEQIESGRMRFEMMPLDIEDVLQTELLTVEPQVRSKGVHVNYLPAADLRRYWRKGRGSSRSSST